MATLLKDELTADTVSGLGRAVASVDSRFDSEAFQHRVLARLHDLELKDRINLIADELAAGLDADADYRRALVSIVAVAEIEPMESWAVGMFAAWPLCSFVERHGVEHPAESLAAMPSLTKRWTCEFAIRPFLTHHLDLTWQHLTRWRDDEHEAVRRLVSEGTRPLLPWGPKVAALVDEPGRGVELIAPLRVDESESVRRSVANHLNDVAKASPDLVTDTLARWLDSGEAPDAQLVRHSLRTLVKQGDSTAMALLGFDTDARVEVEAFTCEPGSITLGDAIELTAVIGSTATESQNLVVDFVIHHPTASGALSTKVFKWTNLRIEPGEVVTLTKRRSVKAISTRTYHPGFHAVELQMGGQVVAETGFDLSLP